MNLFDITILCKTKRLVDRKNLSRFVNKHIFYQKKSLRKDVLIWQLSVLAWLWKCWPWFSREIWKPKKLWSWFGSENQVFCISIKWINVCMYLNRLGTAFVRTQTFFLFSPPSLHTFRQIGIKMKISNLVMFKESRHCGQVLIKNITYSNLTLNLKI